MQPRNPNYKEAAAAIFRDARFVVDVGIEPVEIAVGRVESRLVVQPRHLQHDRIIHAGVQGTMADHTSGAAAYTVIGEDQIVLTVNFLLNLLQAAIGDELRCRARVLKAGRRMVVSESEVFTRAGDRETLVAKATVTLATLDKQPRAEPPGSA
ncbi:MAG TPA: PaaI family thioesterase [Methylomirabilota bacterium]|nr:PaaI family thioesterase [Methylomirabilota bacterium]